MPTDSFVHLHVHTEYSLLDSTVRIAQLMQKACEFGMPAVALTDHGTLYGAIEFYQEAKKAGVKPIIGCEVYIAPGSHKERSGSQSEETFHFTLLARDRTGYRNLLKLVSIAHLDGFHHKPRIDRELLATHAAGLIGLSGCLEGEINMALSADETGKARQAIADYRDILGIDNFFLELQKHGLEQQEKNNAALRRFGKEFGLGLVVSNNVHFLQRERHKAHEVLMCIRTGANIADEKRNSHLQELYFKSPAEMRGIFADVPEAIDNTLAIAERCNLELEFGRPKHADYKPTPEKTREQFLFERFLNPEQVSPPDIDVNGCQTRRGEALDYVRQKYGERSVAQIVTFGIFGVITVVQEVGRVLGLGHGDADRIAKMIPNELGISLQEAAEKNAELKAVIATEPARQLWDYAKALEGLTRNVGVHAAGIVIGDHDLSDDIPLTRANDGSIASQYSFQPLTDLGMLRMEFLGLKTLTVIRDAENMIREKQPAFKIDKIPLGI